MTLRTPRRRISPRTKRRYRAIKDFLRRALGSSSQPDIKINSSIAINVTDLKHKIVGLEQQLSEVNKHCRDLVCLESSSRKDSQTLVDRHELSSLKEQTEISSTKQVHGAETRLLYKTSESHYRKSDDSDSYGKEYNDAKGKDIRAPDGMETRDYYRESKIKKKKSKVDDRLNALDGSNPNLRKHKTRSVYENFVSTHSTSSYHSLIDPRNGRRKTSRHPDRRYEDKYATQEQEYVQPVPVEAKVRRSKAPTRRNSPERPPDHYEGRQRNKSKRNTSKALDQEFIADIIKRQYRPVKMFGQRQSEISQFSAPVCRDQEFPIRENIQEGSELCSCCYDGHRKSRYEYEHDLSDMRSICDTRLYSSKRHNRQRHNRKHTDVYNDSTQYDIVPVKEKSSPKSRRKFVAESMIPYGYYKEVPPSPRTLRPRLNLKAQYYTEFEDYMQFKKKRSGSPKRFRTPQEQSDHYQSNESSEAIGIHQAKQKYKSSKKIPIGTHDQQDVGTMSSLQSPKYNTEPINVSNDSALNKTQETDSSTDKALSEIKDILQCFLQEIKKETTVSQCDNSDITKSGDKCLNEFRQDSAKLNTTVMPNSGHSVNNFSVPQCSIPSPFMPPFANPCCYPVLPVCPMNCVQNGYIFPSPSYTCTSCANNTKEDIYPKTTSPNESASNNVKNNETDELIKEIYKFVAQSPNSTRRKDFLEKSSNEPVKADDAKMLTSRSVGGSSKHSKHDAQVGTQIKCYSKSCEAIGSRFLTDTTYNRTNPSYSDTILERLSLEATATESESEFSSESTGVKKTKKNRFAKVLRSFGLFKKKKDIIEEVSESESTTEAYAKPKKPPFRQEVLNYMMHEQQYYNRPPHQSTPYNPQLDFPHGYGCHAGCPDHLNHVNPMQAPHDHYHPHKPGYEHPAAAYRPNQHRPSAPPYPNPYEGHHNHNQPQVPLCLKEIEVKSIGTQSERKMNIFKKLTKKMQGPSYPVPQRHDPIKNCSTQTAKEMNNKSRPPLFNWKALQAKVNELDNPPSFNLKTQKKLAEGDLKMRNAMLKKLFYKRNPFSPRNLIVRTILGKDKSSYGEPPMMYRPRMFF